MLACADYLKPKIPFLRLITGIVLALVPSAHPSCAAIPGKTETDQIIRFFQAKVAQDPDDYMNFNRLGSAYVQKARESGDLTYYDLAAKSFTKSLELESTQEEAAVALVELGTVFFSEHRFAEALTQAQKALIHSPGMITAHVMAGDAYLEIGEYKFAETAYAHLNDAAVKVGNARKYLQATRMAGLDWIQGRPSSAVAQMQSAVEVVDGIHLPAENVAWTHFMLGEQLFQVGALNTAEKEMQSALRIYPGYHRALAGLGKIRAARRRFSEAITCYADALAVIPLPSYAASLGDLYLRTGKPKEAEKNYTLVEYIGRLGTLNRVVFNRELAMFYADHDREMATALQLAQKELESRHDVYTWDAIAWALTKNGRLREADEAMQKALRLDTQDSLLFFHAGYIQRQLGKNERAYDYLQRALKINPEFHVLYADQARRILAGKAK